VPALRSAWDQARQLNWSDSVFRLLSDAYFHGERLNRQLLWRDTYEWNITLGLLKPKGTELALEITAREAREAFMNARGALQSGDGLPQ